MVRRDFFWGGREVGGVGAGAAAVSIYGFATFFMSDNKKALPPRYIRLMNRKGHFSPIFSPRAKGGKIWLRRRRVLSSVEKRVIGAGKERRRGRGRGGATSIDSRWEGREGGRGTKDWPHSRLTCSSPSSRPKRGLRKKGG